MRQVSFLAAAVLAASGTTVIAEPAAKASDADLFFKSGSSTLAPDATRRLTPIVRWAEKHPCGTVVLDGHTDPRGPDTYNVRLSAQRAEAVRDLLISLGVNEDRIVIGVFGENAPRRASYAQDRRVTASVTTEPLYEIVDEKLDAQNATALVWNEPVSLAEIRGPDRPTVATR